MVTFDDLAGRIASPMTQRQAATQSVATQSVATQPAPVPATLPRPSAPKVPTTNETTEKKLPFGVSSQDQAAHGEIPGLTLPALPDGADLCLEGVQKAEADATCYLVRKRVELFFEEHGCPCVVIPKPRHCSKNEPQHCSSMATHPPPNKKQACCSNCANM